MTLICLCGLLQDGTVVSPKSCPSSKQLLPTIDGECVWTTGCNECIIL